MEYERNGEIYRDRKLINNCIIYHYQDNQLSKCRWHHQQKAYMESNAFVFLGTAGIEINNNRNK
jgi:hypothetical protein